MTTTAPELGRRYAVMPLVLIIGDPWSASLIFAVWDPTPEPGAWVPTAWPSPPVLELPNDTTVVGTLSADEETSTANAQATWSLTEDEVDALAPHNGDSFRISIDGETTVSGEIECLP